MLYVLIYLLCLWWTNTSNMNLRFTATALRNDKNVDTAINFYNQFAKRNDFKIDLLISERVTVMGCANVEKINDIELDGFKIIKEGVGILIDNSKIL